MKYSYEKINYHKFLINILYKSDKVYEFAIYS